MTTTHTKQIPVQPGVNINVIHTQPHKSADHTLSPTLIFLHYWGGSSRTWSAVNSILSQEYNTVAIDFRGWGDSTGPASIEAYSIANFASDVENVIHALGLQQYILVGLSMGGKVAQLLAGQNRLDGLQGIVLVSPAPPTPLVLSDEMRQQQIHAYDNADNARFVAENVLTAAPLPDPNITVIVEDMLRGNSFAKEAWPAKSMTEDIAGVVAGIHVPVLIIAAEKDVVEPLDRVKSEIQGRIQGAELVVVPGSGHLSPVEQPEVVARMIKRIV